MNTANLFLLKPFLGKVRISKIFVVWTRKVANCMILLIFMCQERILVRERKGDICGKHGLEQASAKSLWQQMRDFHHNIIISS